MMNTAAARQKFAADGIFAYVIQESEQICAAYGEI